jgi:hypothetical protein
LAALTEDNGRQVHLFIDSSLAFLEEAANLVDERYPVDEDEEENDEEEVEAVVYYECLSCETEWPGDGLEDDGVCTFCGEEASVREFDEEESLDEDSP